MTSLAKIVGPLPLLLWFLHYSVCPELAFRLPIGSFLDRVQDSKCCFRQPSLHRLPRYRKTLRRPNRQIELSCEGVLKRYSIIQFSTYGNPKRQLTWRGRWFLQGLSVLLRVFAPSSPEKGSIYSMSIHTRAIDSPTFVVFDSSASHAIVSSGRYTVFTTCNGRY